MKLLNVIFIFVASISLSACAAHESLDTAQFRQRDITYNQVALDKDGLSQKQIEVITSTKPPNSFPVDISIVILKNGYVRSEVENTFTYQMINELKKYDKIKRITLIPEFLVPNQINFNAIQELGVRSLSEYILVLSIDGSELFSWTKIFESEYEIHSSINFILVDSFTSAMLTSDKLFSTEIYQNKLFEINERRRAQATLFTEQGKLLAQKLDALFSKPKK